jgi:type III pantothenate kinase
MPSFPLIAADVGNSRIKLGFFPEEPADGLPEPQTTLTLNGRLPEFDQLEAWLEMYSSRSARGSFEQPLSQGLEESQNPPDLSPSERNTQPDLSPTNAARRCPERNTQISCPPLTWHLASVNRPSSARLIDWLRERRPTERVVLLGADDLPLVVKLDRPDMVGVDRLLDALAANVLRTPRQPAVVVDVGSAVTVDLVSPQGAFLGGAILPGIGTSARAMHEFTDLLPLLDMTELTAPPPALGTSTVSAMRSGLFWGAVGAVRQLTEQLTGGRGAQVFLTGGAGPAVAVLMGAAAVYVPHLTLAGIALAARCERLDDAPLNVTPPKLPTP